MSWKPDVMIYHHPCSDGFGAAWAAWMRWRDDVQYIPANYGQPAPDVTGKHVLIGDFSYKRPVLDEMLQTAASIVILDHHKTAEEDFASFKFGFCGTATPSAEDMPGILRDLAELDRPPCVAWFDMTRSGARLVWEFCHPGVPVPDLISLIEDRDLWRFEMFESRAFSLYLRSLPTTFEGWEFRALQLKDRAGRERIFAEAFAIERFYDRQVAEIAHTARYLLVAGQIVPTVACPASMSSDVGHALLDLHAASPYVACYQDVADNVRRYSLRSTDDRLDVAAIARGMGGGGHRNAAGFSVSLR